ncbi:hypothetical protein AMECASPLE_025999 [Ameca splendens]|uniref:Uncharacterized protein n=1 Tax=Ameca splendens TaxID=208324 RepID=A0ABV0XTQ5_9TELE
MQGDAPSGPVWKNTGIRGHSKEALWMMRLWMHPWKQPPCRMDTKIYKASLICLLFFMFKVSWAVSPTPTDQKMSLSTATTPTDLLTPRCNSLLQFSKRF